MRVGLGVSDVQAACCCVPRGARRFAHNRAVGKVKANADQWCAEASYGTAKPDRVRPLTYFTLAKIWTAAQPTLAPWSGDQST